MAKLPVFHEQTLEDDNHSPCTGCPQKKEWGKTSSCVLAPLKRYTLIEPQPANPNDPIDVLIVGDSPSDADGDNFFSDATGKEVMRALRKSGVRTFAVIPAVRCGVGDLDYQVVKKKYKGGQQNSRYVPKKTALEKATEAVEFCKEYVKRAQVSYAPAITVAMGAMATSALGLGPNVANLKTTPFRPKPGLKRVKKAEGTLVTFDRYASVGNDTNLRALTKDLKRLSYLRKTGALSPRGDKSTIKHVVLDTVDKVRKFVNFAMTTQWEDKTFLAMDYETKNTDQSTQTNQILNVGFAFSCDEDLAYEIPLWHPETPFTAEELDEVVVLLRRLYQAEETTLSGFVAHSAQFEQHMSKLFFGTYIGHKKCPMLDTEIMAFLMDENRKGPISRPYALETLCGDLLGFNWYGLSGIKQKRDRLIAEPIDIVNEYVGIDAVMTVRLMLEIIDLLIEEGSFEDQWRLMVNLYSEGIEYTADMQLTGQIQNIALLRALRHPDSVVQQRIVELTKEIEESEEVARAVEILSSGGAKGAASTGMKKMFKGNTKVPFNIKSGAHLRVLFSDVMGLDGAEESVDAKWQKLHDHVPLVRSFQEYQKLTKLDSSYLQPIANWLQHPNSADGRLHPRFKLTATVTGRLACSDPNCYDDKTEILTKRGWIPFPELRDDDSVAQYWAESKAIDFTVPLSVYRAHYKGDMVSLQNQHLDLLVTPNHRCLVYSRRGNLAKVYEAKDYPSDYKQPYAGTFAGGDLRLTPAEVSVLCAIQADGHIMKLGVDFSFKKERKYRRLIEALTAAGMPFRDQTATQTTGRFRVLVLDGPDLQRFLTLLDYKQFTVPLVLSFDKETRDLFNKEVNHWDGCVTRDNQYTSVERQNIDAVQASMNLSGIRAYAGVHSNVGWSIYQTNRDYSMTTNTKKETVPYNGMIYCVTVPSSYVVVRRNNRSVISGNTQNVPTRGSIAVAKQIKALTEAQLGNVLIQLDFSQAEVRWLGIMAADENLKEKYETAERLKKELKADPDNKELARRAKIDGDLHRSTAIGMYKLDPSILDTNPALLEEKRQAAKSICFGLIYGKSAASLAADLKVSVEQMEKDIDLWLSQFPKARAFLDQLEVDAATSGFVRSPFGRYRRLPGARSPNTGTANRAKRQARNTPIQSAASDCCLYAAAKMRRLLQAHPDPRMRAIKLVNTVHDSVVAEVLADREVIRMYCELAQSVFCDPNLLVEDFDCYISVPLAVDFELGTNWANMRAYDFSEESLDEALHDAEVIRSLPEGSLFKDKALALSGIFYAEKKCKTLRAENKKPCGGCAICDKEKKDKKAAEEAEKAKAAA